MSKVSAECLAAALEGLKNFKDDDLREYASAVFAKAKSYDNLTGIAAINNAIREVNDKKAQEYFSDCMTKARSITKINRLVEKFKAGAANMRQMLVRRHKNLSDNVESAQRAAIIKLHNAFFRELNPDEVKLITDGRNDVDIFRAIDGKQSTPMAKSIAEKYHKYVETRNTDTVLSDALPLDYINKDRYLRAMHDPSKLLSAGQTLVEKAMAKGKTLSHEAAKTIWMKTIKSLLNLEKTYAGTKAIDIDGKINMAEVDKSLSTIFDNIVNGRSDIFTKSIVVNDAEAIKKRSRMFFVWKDMESWGKYNKQYGRSNFFDAMMGDINSSGNKIGMAQIFGDDPHRTYAALRKIMDEATPKGKLWWKHTDWMFQEVTGQNKVAVDAKLANFAANARSFTSMASLLKISMQSLNDVANGIMYTRRFGLGYFESYGRHLGGLFNAIPDAERKHFAEINKAMVDSHIGFVGRFIDANNTGDLMKKVSTGYFRRIGLEALDKGNKVSTMLGMSKQLARMSNKSFDKLHDDLRYQLNKFGITPKEWDLLRKKNDSGLFTIDNVDRVTDEELKSLYDETNKDKSLYDLRQDLTRKTYTLFDVASENSVLTPGAWSKAWATFGTSPGTIEGEITRSLMQFKTYAVNYVDKVLVGNWIDAGSAQARFNFALQLMAATMPLSVASMMLDNISNGFAPMPNWSQLSVADREKLMVSLLAPGLSIANKVLNVNNQNQSMLASVLWTPTLRLFSDSASIPWELISGNTKGMKKSIQRIAGDVIPFDNMPVVSPFMRQVFGLEGYKPPGMTRIYGK
jgi:hypothetical protein